ncbi:unnamed protein product [Closterium sp. NIES-54]
MVTTTTPGGQRVSICTCTWTGRHLATLTRRPGSSLYTLATEPPQVAASAQVSASGPVAPPCSCHLLSHQTLLWHHCLGHPSLPHLRCMHSRLLIRAVRLQLRERFREDLPVLRLHSDRGGEFSSDLLRDFCRGEGIFQSFTFLASPQQNEIAERRIGLVMEVARTSMIHTAAPHFLWPFAVRYAAHQINLWPRVSLPETLPTLRWTGKVGDATVFRVWGSRAFVRKTSADKLSVRAIPCIFLGFPPEAHGWQFYHPTSRRVLPSQDVMFDESVPFYHLLPYRSAPLPPPPLFLAPGPRPVDPLPPQGPAPSGVSHVDPLPGIVPVEVAVDSGAAIGATSVGAEPGGAEPTGAEPGGAEPTGAEPGGAELEGAELGSAESEGAESGGVDSESAEPGVAEPRGTASSGGPAGASPRLSPRPEPLSPQQLREWFARRTRLRSGAPGAKDSAAGGTGAGGARATSLGGVGVPAGAGGPRGAGAASPGGARTRGTGAAGAGGAGDPGAGGARARGTGAVEPGARGTGAAGAGGVGVVGAGGTGGGGTGAGGAGSGGVGAGDPGTGGAGAIDPGAGGAGVGGAASGGTGAGGTMQRRPFFVSSPPDSVLCQTDYFTERHERASRPASPVRAARTGRQVPHPRPPPLPSTHVMALRPSSVPLRVPMSPPTELFLFAIPDPESDLARTASPTVTCLLATVVSYPSFESTAAYAIVAKLVEFAAACCLDYATSLVAEFESDCPPSVAGERALGTDVLEDRQEDFECLATAVPHLVAMLLAPKGDPDAPDIPTSRSYAEAIMGPYSSQWQTSMDAEMASWKSTSTYVDAVPPSRANIVDGIWIFRVKRPPGSPPVFKARYIARDISQRQGVDFFHTFSLTPKMTTLRVLLHVVAQRDYELHSLDFSTVFLQGSLHEEI